MQKEHALIGLGSNLGDRNLELQLAVEFLATIGKVLKCSGVYESDPEGFDSKEIFLNAVVLIEIKLAPSDLLSSLLKYESERGRERGNGYQDRPIDMDILFYSNWILQSDSLILPHPRWNQRDFVIQPIIDLNVGEIWDELDKVGLKELMKTDSLRNTQHQLCT